jgi:hypothetical protein
MSCFKLLVNLNIYIYIYIYDGLLPLFVMFAFNCDTCVFTKYKNVFACCV